MNKPTDPLIEESVNSSQSDSSSISPKRARRSRSDDKNESGSRGPKSRRSSKPADVANQGFWTNLKRLSNLSPVEIVAEVSDQIYRWYKTRNWRAVLAVIPPLLLLMTLGGFVVAGHFRSDQSLKNWYRELASEMIGMQLDGATQISEESLNQERSAEDEVKLDLLLKRILQLGDENQEARYFVAISNLRQGKIAAARSMMESLGPIDRRGLDLAHAWLAEDLYRRSLRGEKIPVDQLRHHLIHALEAPRVKYGSVLYGLLAKIFEQENNLGGAARILAKCGEQDPRFVLEPVLLYIRRGMLPQAVAEADSIIARQQAKISNPKTPHDEMVRAYLDTAKALQITNRIEATFPLLAQGLKLSPDNPELRRTLSDSYRVKFRTSISNSTQGQAQVGIELLSKAIEADPTNIAIQSEIAMLQQLGIAATEENRISLIRHIAKEGASDAIRLILAESALQRGEVNSAINDYEVVLADKPNLTIALNNLAVLYAMSTPPRFDEARETIRKALEISPDTSEFYDTSGDIEAVAENTSGAIDFYLLALEGSPDRLRTREKLILLYEKSGDQENAEKQKKINEQIASQLRSLQEQAKAQAVASQNKPADATKDQPATNSPAPNSSASSNVDNLDELIKDAQPLEPPETPNSPAESSKPSKSTSSAAKPAASETKASNPTGP